jgi:manganese/zinc/iron transport system permease protein
MEQLLRFFSFSDPNVRYVVAGMVLLSVSSSVIGTFAFLRKKSLAGDAVSHAVLPGVCLSFLFTGEKNMGLLMVGAFISGWLSLWVVDQITKRSKLKEDTAIGLVLSVFFGLGIVLLTYIQHQGNASQSGLDSFLFGKAAVLMPEDVWLFGSVAVLLILMVYLFYKEFKLYCFDPSFAKSIGLSVTKLEYLLTGLMVMAIVLGIQSVGVVLMAALLITPAAIARFWTNKLERMLFLAVLFSVVAGIAGAYVSFIAPRMPTGPWVVLVLSGMAMFSFMISPEKGIVFRMFQQYRAKRIISEENLLKAMYQLGERDQVFDRKYTLDEIFQKRSYKAHYMSRVLNRLKRQGFVLWIDNRAVLTKDGVKKGSLITRRHRLWESYLTEVVNIAPDHVHEDADVMEHLITEELETRLVEQLKDPSKDPHQSDIPK